MKELSDVAAALRIALNDIESELAEPELSPAALEDFKAAIDNVRTSVLAVITAGEGGDYPAFVRKFRLRRGAQVCQNVLAGVVDGLITADTGGLAEFRSTVDETITGLERLTGEPG